MAGVAGLATESFAVFGLTFVCLLVVGITPGTSGAESQSCVANGLAGHRADHDQVDWVAGPDRGPPHFASETPQSQSPM